MAIAAPDRETLAPPTAPAPPAPTSAPLAAEVEDAEHPVVLDVRDLRTYFFTYDGVVRALDGVTFKIRRGQTTGLVGETGCGKSVTAFSITRLIADPPGRVMGGKIVFDGADLLWGLDKEAKYKAIKNTGRVKVSRAFRRIKATGERMSAVRGRSISTIFQEPTQAMNPIFSISDQLGEVLILHRGIHLIDEMLHGTPDDPAVGAAVEELLTEAVDGRREGILSAAQRLGDAAHSGSLATQAFYIARGAAARPDEARRELRAALNRISLSGLQKRYLQHRRRLLEIQEQLNQVYLDQMKGPSTAGQAPGSPALVEDARRRSALRRARGKLLRRKTRERYLHFYYGLWGVRSRIQRPLKQDVFWRTVKLLEGVYIANPVQVARGYPHELSGGMLQRVMIAMALSSEPEILIADEPTTALDVTIQAQILELMRDLKTRVGTSILLITHDLAVIAEVADRVCVMYAGVIVEQGPVREVFRRPLHPYAQGLLASIPRLDQPDKQLSSIPGSVPDLIHPPTGCRFHPRCPYAMPVCKERRPPMTTEGPEHTVACYLYRGPVAAP